MTDTTYNGWTNYATWRVNLEIFDGIDLMDYGLEKLDAYELSQCLKDNARDIIENTSTEGIARDYAMAFLDYVNWRELAEHYLSDYENDERDEDEDETEDA
jgi:hypothetical protein